MHIHPTLPESINSAAGGVHRPSYRVGTSFSGCYSILSFARGASKRVRGSGDDVSDDADHGLLRRYHAMLS
jgi:hypothetical protein